ncbi:MAG: sigma-70 family RNA polymerase sigma factor [Bacteroidota bacterium]
MSEKNAQLFTKEDLREAYDDNFEVLRRYLFYKTGDIGLAEDLVQEVFIKIWTKREELNKKTLKSLLYTIANNLMINHMNHLKVVSRHEWDAKVGLSGNQQTPQFLLEEKEFEKQFNNCVAALPEGSREVFLMNRIDKLKYGEIAELLGISVKAVEKRMSKALAVIREKLGVKV